MTPDNRYDDQNFSIPRTSKRRRFPVFICALLVACLVGFGVYEWRDFSYVLPEPFKETSTETAFQEATKQRNAPLYAYHALNEQDQEKYRIVYEALTDLHKHAYPVDDLNDIRRIEDCVMADHPEFADQVALVNIDGGYFTPAYVAGVALADEAELKSRQQQIDEAVQECLATIPAGADDYTKAKAVYDWLALTTSYGKDYASNTDRIVINATGSDTFTLDEGSSVPSEHGQTVYNALVEKQALCAGYAKAFQYLMHQLGIECTYVEGSALGGLHAWCLIKLDGDYYFIDPTWGDPEYEGNSDLMQNDQNLDHRYFAVTTEDMLPTHAADNIFTLPECTATEDNYFVRENLMFNTVDAPRLGQLIATAFARGESVSIRCTSEEVYNGFMDDWIDTGEIGRYSPTGAYQYAPDNTGLFTITIWPLT